MEIEKWKFVLRESQSILTMSLPPQAERLKTLEEEERAKGVQARTQVPEEFCAHFDCECNLAKGLGKDEPVVPLRGASEAREFSGLGPVKFACGG
jgi:hypothetical protein